MGDEIKPVETPKPVITETPKNKGEWEKLRQEDAQRWGDLTQERMDQTFRENRETKEKLSAAEQKERNLLAEIERLKTPPPAPAFNDGQKQYTLDNPPQNEDEWNDLFLERPAFATDLRNAAYARQQTLQNNHADTWNKSAKEVIESHPDLYVAELDEVGKPKRDGQGKPILKIDPNTGWPIPNLDGSEKGKLWLEIWNEEDRDAKAERRPHAFAVTGNGPRLMMAEMERRLRQRGAKMVTSGQSNFTNDDSSGVVPPGMPTPSSSSLKFATADEKANAERAVSRGTYKSLEDYCKWRDNGGLATGYAETNSRPDFTKR